MRAARGSSGAIARAVVAVVLALGALVVAALAPSTSQAADRRLAAAPAAPAAAADASWTMLVYAVGDTDNVAQLMVENLAQLTRLPAMENVNVVVLVDLPDRDVPGAPTSPLANVGRFDSAKMLLLRRGGYQELADHGELSMGRPDTLAWFIGEAARRFPAERYGLTLFDHGGAWTGGYVDVGPPEDTDLSVQEIRQGMVLGLQRAGLDRFDLLFHAACLMANYETVHALAPLAEHMAASEELMYLYPFAPGGLSPMARDADGRDVGVAFVEGYAALLDQVAAQSGDRSVRDLAALSVVDGDRVPLLDSALDSFADAAVEHMDEIAPEVARARAESLEFIVGLTGPGSSGIDVIDLGDFLRRLDGLPPDVEVARNAAYAAIQQAVSHQVTGRGTQQATGLSVYLPTQDSGVARSYFAQGAAPAGWGRFVRAFLDADAANAPAGGGHAFTSSRARVDVHGPSGIRISAQLRPGVARTLVDSTTLVTAGLGGQREAVALALPAYVGAGGPDTVQGVWDHSVTALAAGRALVPVTAVYQAQSGGLLGAFLTRYRAPSGATTDVGFRVLLSSSGRIESVSAVDVSNGGAASIQLERGGRLTPYLLVPRGVDFDLVPSDDSIAVTGDLEVRFAELQRGTRFRMSLLVQDANGRQSSAGVDGRVR